MAKFVCMTFRTICKRLGLWQFLDFCIFIIFSLFCIEVKDYKDRLCYVELLHVRRGYMHCVAVQYVSIVVCREMVSDCVKRYSVGL